MIRALAEDARTVGGSSAYYLGVTLVVLLIALLWAALSYHLLEVRFIGARPASSKDRVPARELSVS